MPGKIKKIRLLLAAVLLSLVFYLFWGPLFPWNPIKFGYEKISALKATVYVNNFTERDSSVYHIDQIMQEEENFHGLTYVNHLTIVVLNKESNNKRYLPWLKGSGYSVSLSPLNLIYIGSNARKSPPGIESYLKHELSHMFIDQNTTFKKAMKIHKQAWFVEGIAEYFSGHSFYTKNELMKLMKTTNIEMAGLKEKSPQNMSEQELRLKYSYYRYIYG
ncbi:MAG: hypothetical protein ACE5D0_00150 [Fidelibacterota bacterium]